ncbi:MAG TPA: cation:proton antiporter [Candidatus Acidoferrum sp.]|nr:cation:proton antiporter [Candidatus Acidoferrum sp.]
MNSIETIICLMLLLMAMPDLCLMLGRPALASAFFVIFGLILQFFMQTDVKTMIEQAGEVGFLLVLFEVGLEINLPKFRKLLPSLRFASLWFLAQYALILPLASFSGLTLTEAILSAAALSSCSLSMAYAGWKNYPGLDGTARAFVLQIMIILEVLTIVVLSLGGVAAAHGFGWLVWLKLSGIALAIYLISRFASHVLNLFQWIIDKTTHWRVHFLVLLVLAICAIGDRLGLAAPKTAFFLGLFMSRAEFEGKGVEEYIAPISRRFLVPVFFMSLGLLVDCRLLFSTTALLALGAALLLLGARQIIHRRWLKTGGDPGTYLLLCPNLTMSALAATTLLQIGSRGAATWVVFCGLFLSVISLCLLPRAADNPPALVTA